MTTNEENGAHIIPSTEDMQYARRGDVRDVVTALMLIATAIETASARLATATAAIRAQPSGYAREIKPPRDFTAQRENLRKGVEAKQAKAREREARITSTIVTALRNAGKPLTHAGLQGVVIHLAPPSAVAGILQKMVARGQVIRIRRGVYKHA